MTGKIKNIFIVLLLAGAVISGYCLWLSLRPVEIVAVHHRGNGFSAVLVKSFPLTDTGKIHWWLKNRAMLKEKYNIPNYTEDGYFTVTFWRFGEGYKEEGKYERLCFNDMLPPINCIDKDAVFTVRNNRHRDTIFATYDGHYRLKDNGNIVKFTYQ
ncbi:membrane protein [Tatumella morbirosei]|uniref:Membrane protein n=1 Tax=Tatumella morbirosei TaxID=642227 RepID=A0A095TJ01_9GAMM|nr:DUF943 family protein [Tatumella morbirosei]KGD76697.1 membrane protein [Tatumella morbirosei]